MKSNFLHFLIVGLVLLGSALGAQTALPAAFQLVQAKQADWNLADEDISDLRIADQYVSRHTGVTHIYLQQQHQGIPVYNAITAVHLTPTGKTIYSAPRFEAQLTERVPTTTPKLSAARAVTAAAQYVNPAKGNLQPQLVKRNSDRDQVYRLLEVAHNDIRARLVLVPNRASGLLELAWHIPLDMVASSDYWSLMVNAQTGAVMQQHNYTVYCSFERRGHNDHLHTYACVDQAATKPATTTKMANDGASYRVFPAPYESPLDGPRQLLVDPHDPEASPYGWHDINGIEGAEFTITRGNNVHAYADLDDEDRPAVPEPDGGAELVFDFYFDEDGDTDTTRAAAVTQLFYMNNFLHEFTYHYGFTEEAGNFQQRNYTGVPGNNDAVRAEAQDGGGTNNANFSTPNDGSPPRMQMYLWQSSDGRQLQIESPSSIAGRYETGGASFGRQLDSVSVTGEIAIARDEDSSPPELTCGDVANAAEIAGKIAMIRRGECFFIQKTLNAQRAGAIAVIICNPENAILTMGAGAGVEDPSIPALLIRESDCAVIREQMAAGEAVTATFVAEPPTIRDASFDNGVIAHEYGHGISNRLVAGPNNTGCLFNDEQMGEGWSDFFALVTSVKPDDTADRPRGVGNYSSADEADGSGIRRKRYSPNLSINDYTYDDIIVSGTAPHPLGEIWVTTLWDLYWAMAEQHGFDPDLVNGTGGNNMAVQLVMDGMKFLSCQPGMIDGRDAILNADFVNYDGANQCLIWDVFARRGMGLWADQGSSDDRGDGRQDFTPLPECQKTVKLTKEASSNTIKAGETIVYTLTVVNHKDEAATNVRIVDQLPVGLTFGESNETAELGDNQVTFTIPVIESGEEMIITYSVSTDEELTSRSLFFDGAESGDLDWFINPLEGSSAWEIITENVYEGDAVWFVSNTEEDNDQALDLFTAVELSAARPVLRFFHQYDTEAGWDGGIIQIAEGNSTNWMTVQPEDMIRNGYRGDLAASALEIDNIQGFWGNSRGYIDTYIDLEDYRNDEARFRWRFGSDGSDGADGWYVDNIEILDLFSYEGEARLTSDEGDEATAVVPEGGVIVDPATVTSTDEVTLDDDFAVRLLPNPAQATASLAIKSATAGSATLHLLSADGRQLHQQSVQLVTGTQRYDLPVATLPRGFYVVQVRTADRVFTQKLLLN